MFRNYKIKNKLLGNPTLLAIDISHLSSIFTSKLELELWILKRCISMKISFIDCSK